jgi:hypothetical protein
MTGTHQKSGAEPRQTARSAEQADRRSIALLACGVAAGALFFTIFPSGSMIESGGLAPPYLLPSWLLSVLRPAGLIRVFRFGLRGAWSSP